VAKAEASFKSAVEQMPERAPGWYDCVLRHCLIFFKKLSIKGVEILHPFH
jgi:hypothetical protein